ncbi:hypothetical protein VaNZ11_014401 [Volvox africanus]|uniref:Uncharacterized protein n=1 Tax=Volvox africanus TaxID=51714 RepID=A0ABQ5SKL4_9CHLO|nr:hypothetical protein VaNZ11_014401 [Volvox africanus]
MSWEGIRGTAPPAEEVVALLLQAFMTVLGMVALVILLQACRKSTSQKFAAKTRREVMVHALRKMQREYSDRALFAPMELSTSDSTNCCHVPLSTGEGCYVELPSKESYSGSHQIEGACS